MAESASIRALVGGIVDYAGLFPPAGLDMAAAVNNYASYRSGGHAWMLGRFVCPVARLDEFVAAMPAGAGEGPWRLSVIVGADDAADFERVARFNEDSCPATIDAAEVKLQAAAIGAVAERIPPGVRVYVEIPRGEDPRDAIKAVKAAHVRAKIRTGGVTADAFPQIDEIARFVRACYAAGVAFKATAGLHHPLRSRHRLTYDDDAPSGTMHGFLNVFLAAAFCYNGIGAADTPRLLGLESTDELEFSDDGVAWEEYRLSAAEIETIRKRFATSFGSCSFEEPVAELASLNLI